MESLVCMIQKQFIKSNANNCDGARKITHKKNGKKISHPWC